MFLKFCVSAKATLLRFADQSLFQRFTHGKVQGLPVRNLHDLASPWVLCRAGLPGPYRKAAKPPQFDASFTDEGICHRLQHDVDRQADILFLHGQFTAHFVY